MELREEHEPATALDAGRHSRLGKETIVAYAKGIHVSAIALREGIPVATVYNRIRDARRAP